LAERVLNAEMDHHLAGEEPGNRRNGYGRKTVITDTGQIELEVPRDRQARFDPQLIAKYQRRFPGFDDKIISMYACTEVIRVATHVAGSNIQAVRSFSTLHGPGRRSRQGCQR